MTDMIHLNDNNLLYPSTGDDSIPVLAATLVPDEQRVEFWPQYFGNIPQWIILEPHIFTWMDLAVLHTEQRRCFYGAGDG